MDATTARSGAELAWLLEELCRAGIAARARGWCVGELRPREVRWEHGRLSRAPGGGSARLRAARHLRRGHDTGCLALGVPRTTFARLLVSWGGADAADFLADAVDEAVLEASRLVVWSAEEAEEAALYAIRRRITPARPPSPREHGGRGDPSDCADQMPRSASNRAASRRLFTWPRKRAASAPSIVR